METALLLVNFFICLSRYYYGAAVWCIFTGVAAGLTAHLTLLKRRNRLSHWYGLEELDYMNRLAFGLIAITISGFVYHFVYGSLSYHYKQTYDLSVTLAITQSFIAMFWSLTSYRVRALSEQRLAKFANSITIELVYCYYRDTCRHLVVKNGNRWDVVSFLLKNIPKLSLGNKIDTSHSNSIGLRYCYISWLCVSDRYFTQKDTLINAIFCSKIFEFTSIVVEVKYTDLKRNNPTCSPERMA
ncbi:hypothetical protein Trydic_g4069 [Trypoxylus dichotomus]